MDFFSQLIKEYHRPLNILIYEFSTSIYDYYDFIKYGNITIIVSSYFKLRTLEARLGMLPEFKKIKLCLNSDIPIKNYDVFILNFYNIQEQIIINNLKITYLYFLYVSNLTIPNYKNITANIYKFWDASNNTLKSLNEFNESLNESEFNNNENNNEKLELEDSNNSIDVTNKIIPISTNIICKNSLINYTDSLIKIANPNPKFQHNNKPIISIVIPTYNQAEYTIKCFNSIDLFYDESYEINIIWVDNGSNEENIKLVEDCISKLLNIKVYSIKEPKIIGYVKATNLGIKYALNLNSQYIILQNNDTEVTKNWLKPLIKAMNSDKNIIGACPITNSEIAVQGFKNVKRKFIKNLYIDVNEETTEITKKLHKIFANEYLLLNNEHKPFIPAFFSIIFDAKIFNEIGLLDESFGMGYGDDVDYCNRVFLTGYSIAFVPESYVLHNHRTTFKSLYTPEFIRATIDARLLQGKIKLSLNKDNLKKCVVYTCITNDYDILKKYTCFDDKNCDYICFVDKDLTSEVPPEWHIINIAPFVKYLGYDNPPDFTRIARFFKTHPHLFFSNYEYSLWVDGNIDLLVSPLKLIDLLPKTEFLLIPEHPLRHCIYEEIEACKKLKKDTVEILDKVKNYLLEQQYPEQKGLVQSNVLIRKHNDKICIKFMEEWWNFIKEYSKRDQVSFNYLIWKNNLSYAYIKWDDINTHFINLGYKHKKTIKKQL